MSPDTTSVFANLAGNLVTSEAALGITTRETGCFCFSETSALTLALKRGDEAAFRWLHQQWSARVFRYALALAGADHALADEIGQATWRRLVKHAKPVENEIALWNWLARAARNAAADMRRTDSRYRAALERIPEPRAEDANDEISNALEGAIAQLTSEEKDLLDARYFQRQSLTETASRLGCSTRAVEGRLARLREKLRELIAAQLNSVK